jgi:hypothetical protein
LAARYTDGQRARRNRVVETVVVAMAAAGAVMLAVRLRRSPEAEFDLDVPPIAADDVPDLPCPWCEAPTIEEDPLCPSCGRRFGPLVLR